MRVLAFGAHPDDIEVGMGGTIAKYAQKSHDICMVVATVPSMKDRRIQETEKSAAALGAELNVLDIDPDEMMFSRKLVQIFDNVIGSYKPDVVYTHWNCDSHQDHIAVSNAVISATRKNECSLFMYEQTIPGGITPNGFRIQAIVDISDTIDLKLKSIEAHESQLERNGDWWLQGVKGRASYRGYQTNVKYAEVFEVIKEFIPI